MLSSVEVDTSLIQENALNAIIVVLNATQLEIMDALNARKD